MVYLTKKTEFSASHYYHNPNFSEEENKRIFGKCNNPNGHGHNYVLEVTVKGAVDPRSGFVVDLKELKEIMNREVIDLVDHRFLNKEITEFAECIPTTENFSAFIWNRLQPRLAVAQLHRVRLYESPDLFVDYYGETSLTRRYSFSASHRLHCDSMTDEENRAVYGRCNNPHGHGHNYFLEVTLAGNPNSQTGMLCNLTDLDTFVSNAILERFGHENLNTLPEFKSTVPTTENLCIEIYNILQTGVHGAQLEKVRIEETANNSFEYAGGKRI